MYDGLESHSLLGSLRDDLNRTDPRDDIVSQEPGLQGNN